MCFVTFITLVVDVFYYIYYMVVDVFYYIGCRCALLHSLQWLQMCFVTFITVIVDVFCYIHYIFVDVLCYIHYIGCRCVFYIHYIACRWHPRVLWRGLGSHIHHTTLQSLASKCTIMIDNVISTSKSVVVYINTVLKEFL